MISTLIALFSAAGAGGASDRKSSSDARATISAVFIIPATPFGRRSLTIRAAVAILMGIMGMETVRFGVIGIGNMGSYHANYFHALENTRLTAVCDIDPKRLENAAT